MSFQASVCGSSRWCRVHQKRLLHEEGRDLVPDHHRTKYGWQVYLHQTGTLQSGASHEDKIDEYCVGTENKKIAEARLI